MKGRNLLASVPEVVQKEENRQKEGRRKVLVTEIGERRWNKSLGGGVTGTRGVSKWYSK